MNNIQLIYSEVSGTYELVNHVLTFGMDILWRRKGAKVAAKEGGSTWLDVCSGTGEMAVNLKRLGGRETTVVAADISLHMLHELSGEPGAVGISCVQSDAVSLPFADGSFDLITISFATRNIDTSREKLTACFREFRRVLKPGGRFINLETSQPTSGLIRQLFHLYVRTAIKPIGSAISGSKAGYAYLSHTIPRFYDAETLSEILGDAGFSDVSYEPMMFGAAAIHRAAR